MKKFLTTIIMIAGLCLWAGLADAQAVAVDYTKAKLSWTEPAGAGVPLSYTVKCGTATGVYTLTKSYPVTPPLTAAGGVIAIVDLVNVAGQYFCTVSATNLIGESANATEISFQAGRVPPVPTGLAIVP